MLAHKLKTEGYKFPCDEAYKKWEEQYPHSNAPEDVKYDNFVEYLTKKDNNVILLVVAADVLGFNMNLDKYDGRLQYSIHIPLKDSLLVNFAVYEYLGTYYYHKVDMVWTKSCQIEAMKSEASEHGFFNHFLVNIFKQTREIT